MLSDGQHYVTALLTARLNHHVLDGSLQKLSVIRLKEYESNEVLGRK
jgi:replication factor A1